MEHNRSENLTQRRRGVLVINTSTVSFFVLCIYLAMLFLGYINRSFLNLVSLTLYGFVGLMLLSILSNGSINYNVHMTWYGIFALVCLLSCSYAYNTNTAVEKTFEVIKLFIFSVMFLNAVNTSKRITMVMLVLVLSSLVLFVNLATTGRLDVDERLGTSLTGNANSFAALFMIGAVCSVYFIFFSQKRMFKALALVIFILQLYALVLSGSRKNFLLPVALFACLEVVSTDKNGRKHLIRNMLIGLAIIIGVWWALFNVDFLYDSIGYRMEGMLAAFTGEGEVDASSKVRMNMIEIAIDLWKEKPLLGHGLNNYKYLNNLYADAYAHNNYAELLATLGLVGLIAYYWYYIYLVKKLIDTKSMGVERWYWALAVACLMVFDYGMVSYDMYVIHILLLQVSVTLSTHCNEQSIQEIDDAGAVGEIT